jgi:hypoxia-inducible factor 1-alpha inhibitor (HIF hydroxylase)
MQVHGTKRMLFWPPGDLPRLYPYPSEHLLRRRSRVNLARPDLGRFPLFRGAGALEVVLQPGDLVFFPARWAHYTESLAASVSITCRHRSGGEEADAAE